jgi:hypothetical protein
MGHDFDLPPVEKNLRGSPVGGSITPGSPSSGAAGSGSCPSGTVSVVAVVSPASFTSSSVIRAGSPSKSGSANMRVADPV